jgi:glycosyltransferase involved in cell wall biosynthesis
VCFNSESTVAETLISVSNQTFKNYEHIIIDGKSKDNTLEVINKMDQKKLRVISEPDDGIYDAMNKGISISLGEVIIILNSDDKFTDTCVLQKIANCFSKGGVDLVYSSIKYINSMDRTISFWRPDEFRIGSYKNGYHVPHPGFFASKVLYEKLGVFDVSMRIAADFDLMLRFMENLDTKCARLELVTVAMRAEGESSTFKNIVRGLIDIRRSFKKAEMTVFFPGYVFKRYLPKIKRKIRTSFLSS